MKSLHLILISLGVVSLVAGCGGGGSSSSSGGATIPTAAVQITSTNAQTVVSAANSASQSTASTGGGSASTVVGVSTQQAGQLPSVLSIATSEFDRVINANLPAATVVGVSNIVYLSCATGLQVSAGGANTMTLSYSIAGSTITTGDSFTVAYNACAGSTYGTTTNGSMTFAVTSLTGTFGTVGSSSVFKVTFSNLSIMNNASSVSFALNGDMTINASSAAVSGGNSTTSTISGSNLVMTHSVNGSLQLTNYSESYSYNSYTTGYTYSTNMTLAGTMMNGSVTIANITPFSGTGANAPTAGSMKVSGANGSYVILTANADGQHADLSTYDGSTTTNTSVLWSAL